MKKKKTIDYIIELCLGSDQEKYMLGENLLRRYERWTRSMQSGDSLDFLNCIQDNKRKNRRSPVFRKVKRVHHGGLVSNISFAFTILISSFGSVITFPHFTSFDFWKKLRLNPKSPKIPKIFYNIGVLRFWLMKS